MALGPEDPPLVMQLVWQDQAPGRDDSSPGPFAHALSQHFNSHEQARLASFRHPQDRWRHGLARLGLKRLLEQVLGVGARSLVIQPDRQGKPQLVAGDAIPLAPQFNLSHAGELVLLALHPSQAVGVDGERLDRRCNLERLAPRLLSEQQRVDLASLPADQQHAFLLRQWCRLEAQLKCGGEGLAGLEALRQAQGSRNPDLQLVELALPVGYCGALAWTQHSMEVSISR